ncbi:MAG: hypothetical protein Q8M20_03675 [Rhodocyclaceae bacterium]|nr:hypothetical protein [Rhodocyclaceae bacterium]MDZ4213479.1 hypothetical protein [Rhodocyclaceae bacterium]
MAAAKSSGLSVNLGFEQTLWATADKLARLEMAIRANLSLMRAAEQGTPA